MARPIDSDKLIAEIKKQYCAGCDNYDGIRCRACWVDDAMCLIDDATTVDAVEVVRCKNCKHRIYVDMGDGIGAVGGCELFGVAMHYDSFCSYGERKDGDK